MLPIQQVAQDATSTDTARVMADSTDTFGQFSREVGAAGRQILEGQWSAVLDRVYEGMAGLMVEFIPNVISALFVLLLFYIAFRVLRKVFNKLLGRSKRVDVGLHNLIIRTFSVVAWSFIFVMVLAQFGINVTALLAGLSIAGIAVGFAARDTLENFISGISILLDRPFRIGDNIVIDGTFGAVIEITLRSTRLRTQNNEIMVMPNIQMINQKLINHTMMGIIRIEIPFGIAYKEYPQAAREAVLKLTEGDERLHPEFPPHVVVEAMNDSSVDMRLRIFLQDPKQEIPIRFEYVEKVREALREADIEIPFPHLQLFVDEARAFEDGLRIATPNNG